MNGGWTSGESLPSVHALATGSRQNVEGTNPSLERYREPWMNWAALGMLTGDRSKYLGLILGVGFATLLMSQQESIFAGIMRRTASQIQDVRDADIWVMDE